MDFLSFCPLLVDILQEVDYKDIPNCALVNRRILDVIKRNSLSMPRQCSSLEMNMLNVFSTQSRCVMVRSDYHIMYLSEEFTILVKQSTAIEDYYKENRTKYWSPLSFVGNQIMEYIRVADIHRHVIGSHLVYSNDNLQEGLHTLLSLLFRRYYFNKIELSSDFSEELLKIIGDEFKRNRSKCNTFDTDYTMNGLKELITKLDCKTTIFMKRLSGDIPSMNDVVEIATWNKPIRAKFYPQNSALQDISNFLQEWLSGLFSLGKVTVAAYLLTSDSIFFLLLSLKGMRSVTTDCSQIPEGKRTTQIARHHDKKVMCLTVYDTQGIELEEK